ERKGDQLFGNDHGNCGTLPPRRNRWWPHRRHERQYQYVHGARRVPDYLDGNEGPETRRVAASRHRHLADRECFKNAGGCRERPRRSVGACAQFVPVTQGAGDRGVLRRMSTSRVPCRNSILSDGLSTVDMLPLYTLQSRQSCENVRKMLRASTKLTGDNR